VQNAAHLLDRLVKDIVTESTSFSIEAFIPLLRERLTVLNPYVRQFLVGWITVLDGTPDIHMVEWLPHLLDGLLNMLSDPNREIRQQVRRVSPGPPVRRALRVPHAARLRADLACARARIRQADTALAEFLLEVKTASFVDYRRLTQILVCVLGRRCFVRPVMRTTAQLTCLRCAVERLRVQPRRTSSPGARAHGR
jgi:vacuole morphology and inheritance protein 14